MRSDLRVVANWPAGRLGDVASLTLGGTPSTEVPAFWGGRIPWMASGDVNLREVFAVPGRISELGLRSSNATLVLPPAVAIGLAGQGKTRGTVACTHIELCTNQSIALVKGDEQSAHTRFLFHNLAARYEELRARSSGGGRGGLSKAILEALPIRMPPLQEQCRIAEILDTVDDAIRQTERVIAKLEQMKAGMLHDLLTRGIDDNGEVRDPERYPEQFKDSPLGRIPKGWSHTPIATLIELLDHMRVPVNGDERAGRPGTVPYYGANGQQGWIDRPLFDEPLILLAEDGGNFEEFATRPIAYRISGPAWVNNHAHIIRAAAQTDQGFLFWSLVHKDIRRYIAGGTRSKLTQGELLSIELAAPPESEQRRIAERLDHHQSQLRQEAIALEKLRATKQALADDLLTGRVRVNTREAVPA